MSERLAVCQALAAMVSQNGQPDEQEVTFVGMAALQLGLSADENEKVQAILKGGGDFMGSIEQITSKPMRAFFMRRALAAVLLDDQITCSEQSFIDQAAKTFGCDAQLIAELTAWTKVSIAVENQLAQTLAKV